MQQNQIAPQPQGRLLALDRLKGLCLVLMLFFESVGFFKCFGPLYYIAADTRKDRVEILPGMEWGDCLLPMFLLLIGMSCYLAFTRRAATDRPGAFRHLAHRYLMFAALGSCLVSLENLMNGWLDDIFGVQAICVVCALSGIAYAVCGKCCGKMKNGNTFVYICKVIFYTSVVALVVLDWPLMLIDAWRQLFSAGTAQRFYDTSFMHWSILHVFAYAGILSLPFIAAKSRARTISFIALLAVRYGLHFVPLLQERRSALVMGGPWGTFGWVTCIVGGYILCENYVHAKRPWLVCMLTFAGTVAAAIPATILQPISSRGVSVNFLLLTFAFFTLLLFLVAAFDRVRIPFDLLALWGKSPILIFAIGLAFKVVLLLWLPLEEPLWVALTFIGVCFAILLGVTVLLNKSKKAIKL